MKSLRIIITTLFITLFLFMCVSNSNTNSIPEAEFEVDPFEVNSHLLPGINMGNALEAPNEGDWGITIRDDYFSIMKNAGFNSVRIPIRWSTHAAIDSPYTITPSFLSRVYHVVNQALNNDLYVVINIHHYEEIFQQPAEHKERFLSLWQQIGAHFKDFPNTLVFEVLNEPHDNFTAELWNQYFPEAINIIRETNPNRTIIIGTAGWGGISALNQLSLPEDENNLIVTVHYYEPFTFTHQGAEWVAGSDAWLGTTWSATVQQREELSQHFSKIKTWADVHNRPIYIGEFGTYSKADMNSRSLWTGYVVNQCKQNEFSWAYWEFCSGFGAYDASAGKWRQQLLNALIQLP